MAGNEWYANSGIHAQWNLQGAAPSIANICLALVCHHCLTISAIGHGQHIFETKRTTSSHMQPIYLLQSINVWLIIQQIVFLRDTYIWTHVMIFPSNIWKPHSYIICYLPLITDVETFRNRKMYILPNIRIFKYIISHLYAFHVIP